MNYFNNYSIIVRKYGDIGMVQYVTVAELSILIQASLCEVLAFYLVLSASPIINLTKFTAIFCSSAGTAHFHSGNSK